VGGNVRIRDNAHISDNAQIFGNVLVCNDAQVFGDVLAIGNVCVYGDAEIRVGRIEGDICARINAQTINEKPMIYYSEEDVEI
jgi:predicted acyltransferase (DUF342 family)